MNAEKKLGLAFVGILSVAFVGVLTMRLLDANQAEQIDINVGTAAAGAPEFKPNDGSTPGATSKPTVVAEQSPPVAPRFASSPKTGPERSPGYLPPLPKTGMGATADSRYGGATSPATGALANTTGNGTTMSNPPPPGGMGYSAGSRYGANTASPTSITNTPPMQDPAAGVGATSAASPPSFGAGSGRYGAPSNPASAAAPAAPFGSAPPSTSSSPSFASATPTAAATLPVSATGSAAGSTPSANPYGVASAGNSPTTASATPPAFASSATASGDNPLRSSRPAAFEGSGATTATAATPTIPAAATSDRYATANIPSAPLASSTPAAPPSFGGAPASAMPSAPAASSGFGASSTPVASTVPTNSLREPRAFDTAAAPSQPLPMAASTDAGRTPGVAALGAPAALSAPAALGTPTTASPSFANTDESAMRASNSVGVAGGGYGNVGGGVAPTAATMPVAATPTASAAAQIAVKNEPYMVAPDDNFWSISKKVYGDGSYYRALFAYNSDRYPHAEDVRAGSVLDVPPAAVLKQRYPELVTGAVAADGRPTDATLAGGRPVAAAAATYTVREGDTLFDIARRQLGKATRWTEVYELNRQTLGDNLENLRPGTQLVLPQ